MRHMPRNFSGWSIYLMAGAVCVGMTAASWIVAVGPALQQQRTRAAQVQELSRERHKAATLRAALAAARSESAQLEKTMQKVQPSLDPATLVNTHMARITAAANECGLSVEELQPGKSVDTPYYKAVELKIAGVGAYPQVTRFLHRVHEDFADVGVRSMELTAAAGNALAPPTNFRLGLIWFAAPADAPQGPLPLAKDE